MTPKPLSSSVGWRLSRHARDAAQRRGFELADVLLTAATPEVSYTQENYGVGRAIHQRARIAVAVHVPSKTILTVLLRTPLQWTDSSCVDQAS